MVRYKKSCREPLQQSIFLTNLKLYWDKSLQAYKSSGPIGLGFIGKARRPGMRDIWKFKGGEMVMFSVYTWKRIKTTGGTLHIHAEL